LIICGDVGINLYGNPEDYQLKTELAKLPITLLCIYGNHEIRPENINTYDEVERFAGIVYMKPEFPNLLFARDGEIYELDELRCIAIGGAFSVDGGYGDEQPSEEIKRQVEERLKSENWKVDIVFSHTCPLKYVPEEAYLPGVEQEYVDKSTEEWLDTIEDKLDYSEWYCGHFHIPKTIASMRFLHNDILELE